jgi:TPR repeat protein
MKSSRTDWSSAARIRNDAEKGSGAVVVDIDILLQRATAGDVTAAWQYGYARLVGEFEHSVKGVIRCRRNRREALKWLEYAAKNGCSGAMLELGAYWSSIGVKSASDRRLALLRGLQWEKKAWCAGEVVAATNIAVTYSLLGEYRRSYLWLRKAYAQSPWAARLLLAEAYMKGMGVKRDIGKAWRLCEELLHDDMASECERESAFEYLKRLSYAQSE